MGKILKEQIVNTQMLCKDVYKMTIRSEYVASNAKPGQFVNVRCGGLDAMLRRPISICDVNKSQNTFDIVIQVKTFPTKKYQSR